MRIEFQIEEPSAEAALKRLLPRILQNRAVFGIIDYRNKQRMLRELPKRFQGYARRLAHEDLRIVVLIDQDADDCRELKSQLEDMAMAAGLLTKTKPAADGRFLVVSRIAIEELEAWFFGDIGALRAAYPRLPATIDQKAAYRNPDRIRGGTWEALHRELQKVGHCDKVFPKIEVARTIARHMEPDANRSRSFKIFRDGIEALLAQEAG